MSTTGHTTPPNGEESLPIPGGESLLPHEALIEYFDSVFQLAEGGERDLDERKVNPDGGVLYTRSRLSEQRIPVIRVLLTVPYPKRSNERFYIYRADEGYNVETPESIGPVGRQYIVQKVTAPAVPLGHPKHEWALATDRGTFEFDQTAYTLVQAAHEASPFDPYDRSARLWSEVQGHGLTASDE